MVVRYVARQRDSEFDYNSSCRGHSVIRDSCNLDKLSTGGPETRSKYLGPLLRGEDIGSLADE